MLVRADVGRATAIVLRPRDLDAVDAIYSSAGTDNWLRNLYVHDVGASVFGYGSNDDVAAVRELDTVPMRVLSVDDRGPTGPHTVDDRVIGAPRAHRAKRDAEERAPQKRSRAGRGAEPATIAVPLTRASWPLMDGVHA